MNVFLSRESVKKNTDVYEDLPLFAIEEKFNKTEGGKQLGSIYIYSIYLYLKLLSNL